MGLNECLINDDWNHRNSCTINSIIGENTNGQFNQWCSIDTSSFKHASRQKAASQFLPYIGLYVTQHKKQLVVSYSSSAVYTLPVPVPSLHDKGGGRS